MTGEHDAQTCDPALAAPRQTMKKLRRYLAWAMFGLAAACFVASSVTLVVAHSIPYEWNYAVGCTGYIATVAAIPLAFMGLVVRPWK